MIVSTIHLVTSSVDRPRYIPLETDFGSPFRTSNHLKVRTVLLRILAVDEFLLGCRKVSLGA